jgi:heme-degrading monooxygenase HmoA
MKIVLFHIRTRPDLDEAAYEAKFAEMLGLVSQVPGFLGMSGFSGEDGTELAVARFSSDEALKAWREDPGHLRTQEMGRREFFSDYTITVADVDREYTWRAAEEE